MAIRSTRLEFLIVTIAFVVLLLCSRPPRSGNAEITEPAEPAAQPGSIPEKPAFSPVTTPSAPAVGPAGQDFSRQTHTRPLDVATPDSSAAPKPATKRMASVDARNCTGLNYKDLMYGEVTVRWVWDGNRFAPRKVCVVQEPDGVTTTWSFDDPGSAVLTEIGEAPLGGQ